MKLLVFPGGGSPDNEQYHKVYELLVRNGGDYGYESVDISLRWPGHANILGDDPGTRLAMNSALGVAISKIREVENQKTEFHILGRSFGASVALNVAITYMPKGLRKLILWGAPPYWLLWEMFVQNLSDNAAISASKGLYVDETCFLTIIPVEVMLEKVTYPTVIATGTKDKYSTPEFHNYLLSSIGRKNRLLDFRTPVEGAPHEVSDALPEEVISAYMESLFA